MVSDLLAGLTIGLVAGAAVALTVLTWLAFRSHGRRSRQVPITVGDQSRTIPGAGSGGTDPSTSTGTDTEPAWTCRVHNLTFEEDQAAFTHAVEYHNAPRDGDTWKQTYPEGRGDGDGTGGE